MTGIPSPVPPPPPAYDRPPTFDSVVELRDAAVPMRDGVHLCVDVFHPEQASPSRPCLRSRSTTRISRARGTPAAARRAPLWTGPLEAGDTRFLRGRGYAHVRSPRGFGSYEQGGERTWDSYDLIEWIAAQPWCDGNVGMVGISGYGAEQLTQRSNGLRT